MKRPTVKQLYQQVEDWNNRVLVGAEVTFRKDDGTKIRTKTRSKAQMLGEHTPVVWLSGVSGCVLLDRVNP